MFHFNYSEAEHKTRGHFSSIGEPQGMHLIQRDLGIHAHQCERAVDGSMRAFGVLLGAGLLVATVCLASDLFHLDHPARKKASNRRGVELWKKEYVSVRDSWRCTYCGRRVTQASRHVDHSRSLANGGTDHLNNLRLACSPCNLSKGALNSRDFYC